MIQITAWNEVYSPIENPGNDFSELAVKTTGSQTGLLGLAADTEYWKTSGSMQLTFTVPSAITWDQWLDWALSRWTTVSKEDVRNSPEIYIGMPIVELAMLSSSVFFGRDAAIKLSENFRNLKNQPYPLPKPENFSDPVERAYWHVFWNLDSCLDLATGDGALIMRVS